MKKLLAVFLFLCAAHVQAYVITAGGTPLAGQGLVSSVPGVHTNNFNNGQAPNGFNYEYVNGQFELGGGIYTGGLVRNVNDGIGHLLPNDPTYYFTSAYTNFGYADARLPGRVGYFGFYWGSPDPTNVIQLYFFNQPLLTLTGAQLADMIGYDYRVWPNSDKGVYVNIFATTAAEMFNTVRFTNNGTPLAFESDNHAYSYSLLPVPEPGSAALMLAGLGLLAWRTRRKA